MMKALHKVCLKGIAAIGAIIFLFLSYYSWRYTARMLTDNEDLVELQDGVWQSVLMFAFLIAIVILLQKVKRIRSKGLNIIAILISVSVSIFLCIVIKEANAYAVSNDQIHVYLAACEMVENRFFELEKGAYFGVYPFQLGLSWLYSLLFLVANNTNAETIQIAQAILVGGVIYLGFCVTKELFGTVVSQVIYLILAVMGIPLYLYSLFIYGEVISTFGCVASIYMFLVANRLASENRWKQSLLCCGILCVCFAVAYIARASVLIIWIAMMIVQIINTLRSKRWIPLVMAILVFLAAIGGQSAVISNIEEQSGCKLDNAMPKVLWVAMGLQGDIAEGEKPGVYNAYNWSVFADNDYNVEKASEIGWQYIEERVSYWMENPGEMFRFFKTKLLSQWNEPSCGVFTMTRFMEEPSRWISKLYYGDFYEVLYSDLNCLQAVAYLATCLVFIFFFRSEDDEMKYLPGLVLIGGFLFSALWESKSRYIFPYSIILLPYAAGGVTVFGCKVKRFLSKEKLGEYKNRMKDSVARIGKDRP